MDDLVKRIEKRLKKLNKTERQASLEANLSDSFIRNIRLGRSSHPRIDTLRRLAAVLQTNVDWLYLGKGMEEYSEINGRHHGNFPIVANTANSYNDFNNNSVQDHGACGDNVIVLWDLPPNIIKRKDIKIEKTDNKIPVYGRAVGGEDGAFELNGNKLFDVMTPPSLFGCSGAYAIEICGSSMSPRYEEGEIAYVDPLHKFHRGDYVVVQIQNRDGDVPQAYIKRYLYKNSKEIVLEQFNPHKKIIFPLSKVLSVHYVVMAGALC